MNTTSINWRIYIVSHKQIVDEMYNNDPDFDTDHYVYVNVGKNQALLCDKEYKQIRQNELENYCELGSWWAESEAIYNVWRSGIYKELDYIGFLHYDKELCFIDEKEEQKNYLVTSSILNLIENDNNVHISFEDFDIKWDFNQHIMMDPTRPNELVGDGKNCYFSILDDYNEFFGTENTMEDLLSKNSINLCSCFMIPSIVFDKMMRFWDWVIKTKRLDGFDLNHKYRFQGGMAERYFGVFLAFEYDTHSDLSLIHHANEYK